LSRQLLVFFFFCHCCRFGFPIFTLHGIDGHGFILVLAITRKDHKLVIQWYAQEPTLSAAGTAGLGLCGQLNSIELVIHTKIHFVRYVGLLDLRWWCPYGLILVVTVKRRQ
jgi:hypothetical protein